MSHAPDARRHLIRAGSELELFVGTFRQLWCGVTTQRLCAFGHQRHRAE
jgi:hypothetical protein